MYLALFYSRIVEIEDSLPVQFNSEMLCKQFIISKSPRLFVLLYLRWHKLSELVQCEKLINELTCYGTRCDIDLGNHALLYEIHCVRSKLQQGALYSAHFCYSFWATQTDQSHYHPFAVHLPHFNCVVLSNLCLDYRCLRQRVLNTLVITVKTNFSIVSFSFVALVYKGLYKTYILPMLSYF